MKTAELDRFVLQHRPAKNQLDPYRAYASMWEEERDSSGALASTAVVFITNRECPFRCVMCDLWVNTLDESVPRGAIATQINGALARLLPARQIKLYNAGSFFDPAAIPPEDDEEIAAAIHGFERVIVESHPAFLAGAYQDRCLRFRDLISGQLEVAIGLETAHPGVLERLNKKMTLDAFKRAAAFLLDHDIALRVFILLSPPFMPAAEAVEWACRSLDFAASVVRRSSTVIPTRGGNGAMEAIGDEFHPPLLRGLEAAVEYRRLARRDAGVCRSLERRALLRLQLLRGSRGPAGGDESRTARSAACGVHLSFVVSASAGLSIPAMIKA